jgi:hypothetical protein
VLQEFSSSWDRLAEQASSPAARRPYLHGKAVSRLRSQGIEFHVDEKCGNRHFMRPYRTGREPAMSDIAPESTDACAAHHEHCRAELAPYQMFMFGLGVYVLLALAAQTFLRLSASTNAILDHLDDGICLIFFFDFFVSLFTARSKLAYLKWGWIDLISSIPMIDMFRAGRIARIIRILRAFRGVRSARFVADYLIHQRANGAFFGVALLSILLVLFSSIAILQFENTAEANIRTPQDALWWALHDGHHGGIRRQVSGDHRRADDRRRADDGGSRNLRIVHGTGGVVDPDSLEEGRPAGCGIDETARGYCGDSTAPGRYEPYPGSVSRRTRR